MSDIWFVLDERGRMGPFTHAELLATLATYPDRDEVLVKRDGQKSWQRAGDFPELSEKIEPKFERVRDTTFETIIPKSVVSTPNLAPTPARLSAAHRWVKGGAIVGFIIGALNVIAQISDGKANNNAAYLLAVVVVSACIGGVIALIVGAIADWMSRPKKTAAGSIVAPSTKSVGSWNFIATHWYGQLPLWISYWIINFVVSIASVVLVALIAAAFEPKSGYDPMLAFGSISTMWFAIVAIVVWQIVGVWRSANNHIARRAVLGKTAPWAGLAKLAVIGMTIKLGALFINSGRPQLNEVSRIAFMGDPDMPSYAFRIMRNGTEVEITGGFKYGLTDEFSKLLKASRQIKVVHLDSLGGRIGEAKKLYQVIRQNGLVTYVSSKCASACTLAFAGGKERYIARNATLGFHSPSFPGIDKDELRDSISDQSKLFIQAGFSPAFVSRALNTPSSDLWRPTVAELYEARAITGVSDGTQFAASGYGEVTKESMAALLARGLPLLQTIKDRMPKAYQNIIDAYYDSYVAGDTEAAQISAARVKLMPLLSTLKPMADDDVLVDLAKLFADSYRTLSMKSATTCYLYASGMDTKRSYTEDLGPVLLKRELDLNERVVRTAKSRTPAPSATLDLTWAKLRKLMSVYSLTDGDIDLLTTTTVLPSKYQDYCLASISFYSAVAALPQRDAAIAMRAMLEQK